MTTGSVADNVSVPLGHIVPSNESCKSTYGAILKSSSIIGGSKAIEYLIGMVKMKTIAVLLGPSGVGTISLFTSSIGLVGQFTSFGIQQAGVREIARANGAADLNSLAKSVTVLRRFCWVTGAVGWLTAIALSRWLSLWSFDSSEKAPLIALLGVTLLVGAISGGQAALIQGTRRIGDLARMSVLASGLSTALSIAVYLAWRERGIVPALILSSVLSLLVSWWFSRKIALPHMTHVSGKETLSAAKSLAGLGFAMMWGGMLAAVVDIAVRGLVVRNCGIEGTGIYQAAWTLSGMFGGFVIGAMGADFYPRLSSMTNDHQSMNRIVNEQIEIGVLLTLPGLLATLFFGPLVILVFYSSEFGPAAQLLPWFVMGVFCQVVSWPLGFTILAKGASRWFFFTQTHFRVVQLLLVYLLISRFGLQGVGVAFFVTFIPAGILNLIITRRLTGFCWSPEVRLLLLISSLTIASAFILQAVLPSTLGSVLGLFVTTVVAIINARGVTSRLGNSHRISLMLARAPGGSWLIGDGSGA